ncbi:MAG: hypothetical protein IT317_17330 [Anaerolineales bacterium]|nr:hypothetical protein [Anaerolineales bacterium]
MHPTASATLRNAAFELTAAVTAKNEVHLTLRDVAAGTTWAEGAYTYRLARAVPEGDLHAAGLTNPQVAVDGEALTVSGTLNGLRVTHTLRLPAAHAWLEEQLTLTNPGREAVRVTSFAFGFRRVIANVTGHVPADRAADRLAAVPFRHRATDPGAQDMDFSPADLLSQLNRAPRVNFEHLITGYAPTPAWASEGWALTSGGRTLLVAKHNPAALEWSIAEVETEPRREIWLRFGGAGQLEGEPDSLSALAPGQRVTLGVTRYASVADYTTAAYAFRALLDEHGCRFPAGFNPPVHWNELYDNPEWSTGTPGNPPGPRRTRAHTYTRALLFEEAAKAKAYGCQALYLDPGWDVEFGSLLWADEWLGDLPSFVAEVRERFGLSVSLHCPLAAWASVWSFDSHLWPAEANRLTEAGERLPRRMCQASRQYMDEVTRRLQALCAAGVKFLMFDGNAWPGECWDPEHGHSVPLTYNEHCAANSELARRIHAEYPDVLIEMHDAIVAGMRTRYTPVYYGYEPPAPDRPGTWDENWGFELMWQPMEEIESGRARALYYYNLACNVPVYLHVDLRTDNARALLLWWYASTCRHLGIGGTHPNPQIAALHRAYMARYHELQRFFKEGEFFGVSETFHVHVLRDEEAFVVNIFNLSDQPRNVTGSIAFELMGLPRDRWYVAPFTHPEGYFDAGQGTFNLNRRVPAWGAEVFKVYALPAR